MSLRHSKACADTEPASPENHSDVSLRALLLGAVSIGLGAVAWRFPVTINPMLIAVAAYAVLDRLTDGRSA
jgi:hypothetical protein